MSTIQFNSIYEEGLFMIEQLRELMEILCLDRFDREKLEELKEIWHRRKHDRDSQGNL